MFNRIVKVFARLLLAIACTSSPAWAHYGCEDNLISTDWIDSVSEEIRVAKLAEHLTALTDTYANLFESELSPDEEQPAQIRAERAKIEKRVRVLHERYTQMVSNPLVRVALSVKRSLTTRFATLHLIRKSIRNSPSAIATLTKELKRHQETVGALLDKPASDFEKTEPFPLFPEFRQRYAAALLKPGPKIYVYSLALGEAIVACAENEQDPITDFVEIWLLLLNQGMEAKSPPATNGPWIVEALSLLAMIEGTEAREETLDRLMSLAKGRRDEEVRILWFNTLSQIAMRLNGRKDLPLVFRRHFDLAENLYKRVLHEVRHQQRITVEDRKRLQWISAVLHRYEVEDANREPHLIRRLEDFAKARGFATRARLDFLLLDLDVIYLTGDIPLTKRLEEVLIGCLTRLLDALQIRTEGTSRQHPERVASLKEIAEVILHFNFAISLYTFERPGRIQELFQLMLQYRAVQDAVDNELSH